MKRFTLKLRAYAEYFRQRKHAEKFGINQIRGLLLERGITLRKGRCHVDEALPGIMEDASAKLSGALRVLLAQLKLESITCKCGSTKPMW